MSHFTVVVIGDDYEEQLEPFYEGLEVEPYPEPMGTQPVEATQNSLFVQGDKAPAWDVHWACYVFLRDKWGFGEDDEGYEKTKERIKNDVDAAIKELPFDPFNINEEEDCPKIVEILNQADPGERYGYNEVDGLHRMSTYNPDSKWDWYQIGGRWRGFFRVREDTPEEARLGQAGVFGNDAPEGKGRRADQLMVGSIDFESMKEDAARQADKDFDTWQEVLDSVSEEDVANAKPWKYYYELAEREVDYSNEEARADYAEQPVIKEATRLAEEYREQDDDRHWKLKPLFGCPIENFGLNRQDYVERTKNYVAVPYALLKDGQWYQKGEMGWFGMAKNEMTDEDWAGFVHKTYSNLKPTDLMTLVDAHI